MTMHEQDRIKSMQRTFPVITRCSPRGVCYNRFETIITDKSEWLPGSGDWEPSTSDDEVSCWSR